MIRPILRGKDIKRYGYVWAGLWLINTHNGVRGKYAPIDINDYPTIKQHLDSYWEKICARDDKGVLRIIYVIALIWTISLSQNCSMQI